MTATRSQTCLTTERSWETKIEGEVEFVDEVGDQVEDLGADGDVEGADWFVGDEDSGAGGEGAGDGDALALAAGELVRVAVAGVGGEADCFE